MIPILVVAGLFILWAKNKQDNKNSPIQTFDSGISHIYGKDVISKVTERQPPWGDTSQYDFRETVNPILPNSGGGISPTYPTAVSNIRIGGIARTSGGGSFN